MFQFCLVGYGRWGKIYYDTIKSFDFCKMDSIVLSGNNTNKVDSLDPQIFFNIEDVIKNRKIDGFIIATPPHTHFNLAKICLENNFPIIVEKPFTECFEQANKLVQIAKKNNTLCMVGYQHLYSENYLAMKNSINFNLKNIKIYSESLSNGPFRNNVSVFRDWGSHELAIALNLFNEIPISYNIKKIKGINLDNFKGIYFMELNFTLNRKFCSIFGNISEFKRRTLIVKYEDGCAYLNGIDHGGCVFFQDGSVIKPELVVSTGIMPVNLMIKNFVTQAESKCFDFKSLNPALEIVSLIDKIEFDLNMENSNV